ncbi:MAG: Zn-ribbon domain-containing OB-fold protein [Gammaproteobacteria bacterium]|nr:Zn-ribbon domain-containing OB-fold protein [Gammaproteobacteria bacterium]
MSANAKPLPPINPGTQPFWDACAQGRLLLQRCGDCGHLQFYPRVLCAACGSRRLDWVEACGRGTVRTFTIIRRAVSAAFEPDAPYVVALVELEEGPTLMSNIVGCAPASVAIGQPVRVTFEIRAQGVAVPQFEPAA